MSSSSSSLLPLSSSSSSLFRRQRIDPLMILPHLLLLEERRNNHFVKTAKKCNLWERKLNVSCILGSFDKLAFIRFVKYKLSRPVKPDFADSFGCLVDGLRCLQTIFQLYQLILVTSMWERNSRSICIHSNTKTTCIG